MPLNNDHCIILWSCGQLTLLFCNGVNWGHLVDFGWWLVWKIQTIPSWCIVSYGHIQKPSFSKAACLWSLHLHFQIQQFRAWENILRWSNPGNKAWALTVVRTCFYYVFLGKLHLPIFQEKDEDCTTWWSFEELAAIFASFISFHNWKKHRNWVFQ